MFQLTSSFLEEIFLEVKNLWKPPFPKKGDIFSSPKPTSKKWRKRRATWITSLHSGLPELPPPPDGPTYIISVSGIFTKGLYQKKQLPFLGGEVRYQKIDGKKIYISPSLLKEGQFLEDCHTIPYPWGLFFWPGVTKLGRIRFHQFQNRNVFFPAHLGCNFLFPHPISGPTTMSSMVSPSSAFCWDGLGEIWKNMWSLRSDDPLFL